MLRKWWRVQRGPSYQFSPEMISGLPSPLTSATAHVSFEPKSMVCFSNGMSGVRPMLHRAPVTIRQTTTAIQCRVMRTILPRLLEALEHLVLTGCPARAVAMAVLLAFGIGRADLRVRSQEIGEDLGVVYAVTVADINGDGKPDVVAINPTQVLWFENPSWQKHV